MLFTDVKLAIAPINWTNDDDPSLGGETSFVQCIREMREAGYVGTEIGTKYPKEPAVLLNALSEQNLKVSSAWFSTYFLEENGYEQTLENFMHFLSFMKAVHADVINICDCSYAIQQKNLPLFAQHKITLTEKQWQLLLKGLHAIGRLAYDYQIKVSYHYHLGTCVQNKQEIDFLMEHTSPQLLGLLLDTGHAFAAGVDPNDLLEKYGNRINNVHLKDVRNQIKNLSMEKNLSFMSAVRSGLFTVPGDGEIDFVPIFAKLSTLNYRGWMVVEAEQDPAVYNPLKYAIQARKYIAQCTGL